MSKDAVSTITDCFSWTLSSGEILVLTCLPSCFKVDYNSWVESDKGRKFRATLDPNFILAEGYEKHYDLGRRHMCQEGDWREDREVELELDGIGGVNILVKADVHRTGINFPAYAFENQAETEGFARMAKRAGYQVIGLPNYVVWHADTEEKSNH